jgi:hypothetical protein
MTTLAAAPAPSDVPFFHTVPLWVLDAAAQKGVKGADMFACTTTAKTASVMYRDANHDTHTVKVFRRNAFPGRGAA